MVQIANNYMGANDPTTQRLVQICFALPYLVLVALNQNGAPMDTGVV